MFRDKPPDYDPNITEADGSYGAQIDEHISLAWGQFLRMRKFRGTFEQLYAGQDDETDKRNRAFLDTGSYDVEESIDESDESDEENLSYSREESQGSQVASNRDGRLAGGRFASQALHTPSPLASSFDSAQQRSYRHPRSEASQESADFKTTSQSRSSKGTHSIVMEPPPSRSPSLEYVETRPSKSRASSSTNSTLVSSNEKQTHRRPVATRPTSFHSPSETSSVMSSHRRTDLGKYVDRNFLYEQERHQQEMRIQELEKENGQLIVKVEVLRCVSFFPSLLHIKLTYFS